MFDEQVDEVLREVCLEIEKRYEIKFIEIGVDKDHVQFLVQSVPTYSVTTLVKMIKSLTAKEVFRRCPQVKQKLWGGEFWSSNSKFKREHKIQTLSRFYAVKRDFADF